MYMYRDVYSSVLQILTNALEYHVEMASAWMVSTCTRAAVSWDTQEIIVKQVTSAELKYFSCIHSNDCKDVLN